MRFGDSPSAAEIPATVETRAERDDRGYLVFGFAVMVFVSAVECITAAFIVSNSENCEHNDGGLNLADWVVGNVAYALLKVCFYSVAILSVSKRMCPRVHASLFEAYMVLCFLFSLAWMVWGIVILSGSDACSDSRVYKASIAFVLFRGLGALNTFLISVRDRVVTYMIA